MSYFNKLFGYYTDIEQTSIYLFGKKFVYNKKENKNLFNKNKDLCKVVQRVVNIALLHQKTFSKYKNINNGKTVVLVGAGPSLNYYVPIKNAIYVGVNRAFLNNKIKFDYLFAIDKYGLEFDGKNYLSDFLNYRNKDCIKFIGDQNLGEHWQIPEGQIIGQNIERYKTTSGLTESSFTLDIDSEPLGNFATVALQAIQFILYTNPSKIYLVGIDCTHGSGKHFVGGAFNATLRNENMLELNNYNIRKWQELRRFVKTYYPDTDIISVNPVNLKGVFKDEYTEQYVETIEEDKRALIDIKLQNYLNRNNYKQQIKSLSKKLKNQKVIIYGAGQLFEAIKNTSDLSAINIIGITDKKFMEQDKEFLDYKIIPVAKVAEHNPDYIIVSTLRYIDLIEQLENKEFKQVPAKILPLVENKIFNWRKNA